MTQMVIKVTLPYSCVAVERFVNGVYWGNGRTGIGSCRALPQQCGRVRSIAAVPYFDMWCLRPSGTQWGPLGGLPMEMQMNWILPLTQDKC